MCQLTLTHHIIVLIAVIITKWSIFSPAREFWPAWCWDLSGSSQWSSHDSWEWFPLKELQFHILSWPKLFCPIAAQLEGSLHVRPRRKSLPVLYNPSCAGKPPTHNNRTPTVSRETGKTRARIIVTLLNIANSSLPLSRVWDDPVPERGPLWGWGGDGWRPRAEGSDSPAAFMDSGKV